ncbi:dTDP-4-dehydrorhamnose reductase [Rhodoferax saidenbachensis]|uniref:dTDP-4-dehydrorhamnose reductase n=1 Tax=Rhodoferax saidenbachensis TaxID=1484693 RepID=A0ABU1ZM45_9BURK|nr:dTDP-4-dehydrorhamnose reductase [Rhodoferax saidenbachensis]MDR7305641.1 dTDP-4-dehydrorhamnose reductase [Rhodoferax saidenbachensis]
MKILLLGCNGQVGWELQRALGVLGEVIALGSDTARNPGGLCGNLTDLRGLTETVERVAPDVIVNAAAHTAVDKAESEPELAHTINALAPAVLAQAATKIGAWLVHYSTDYVFDGSGSTPWKETDATGPLSVYGQTKLAGEQAVATTPKHLILRTSWVYAARGGNFAKTMLRLAAERDALTVINDQYGAPTSAELLADVTAHAVRTLRQRPELAGLYHCIASGETTWHGYAQFVLTQAQVLGLPLKAGPAQVTPTSTSSYPTPAKRPLNSRLDTHKLQAAFGLSLPHWQPGVARMLTEISGK